jgi:hypothetical protein
MSVSIRRATPTDTPVCGPILFSAFKSLAEYHRLPLDIASVEVRSMITSMLIGHSKFYGVVAEENGRVLGSNFIDFLEVAIMPDQMLITAGHARRHKPSLNLFCEAAQPWLPMTQDTKNFPRGPA